MTEEPVEPTVANPGRPFWLAILAVLFLLLVAAGWLRFAQAWQSWDLLVKIGVKPGPLYLLLGGAAWGLVGLLAAVGLWFGWRGVIGATWVAAVFYPLTYWLDHLLIAHAPEVLTAWPFALVVTVLWLGFVLINLNRPASRRFLK